LAYSAGGSDDGGSARAGWLQLVRSLHDLEHGPGVVVGALPEVDLGQPGAATPSRLT